MRFLKTILIMFILLLVGCADQKAVASDRMCFNVAEAMSLQAYGISPKRASLLTGNTFQFTITNHTAIPGIAPKVVSRNTGVVTVDSLTGLATGVSAGTTFVVASTFNGSCVRSDSARVTVSGSSQGNAANGLIAWMAKCQTCHMADQPWDLKFFSYPDSNIHRRALAHVTHQQSVDIIAYVRSLGSPGPLGQTTMLYQPGTPATPTANDSMFAIALWEADEWRTSITRDTLLAQNPMNVRIPIPLPVWSDELTRYDWMPGQGGLIDGPIPPGVLARGIIQNRFQTWRNTPNMTNAVLLATAIINESHDASIPDAPCMYGEDNWAVRYDSANAQRCFDVAKWASGLCYLTGVKNGISADSILKRCEATWWETGHMAHKAQQRGRNIELRSLQISAWIYLGSLFSFASGTHGTAEAALYFAGPAGHGVTGLGHGRWTTWVVASMLTRRPATTKGTSESCRDINEIAESGHGPWILNAMTYGFKEMLYRLDNNMHIDSSSTLDDCTNGSSQTSGSSASTGFLGLAMQHVQNRRGSTEFNLLKPLADSVRMRINAL